VRLDGLVDRFGYEAIVREIIEAAHPPLLDAMLYYTEWRGETRAFAKASSMTETSSMPAASPKMSMQRGPRKRGPSCSIVPRC
jgi:hypothetical protein